jgi:tetratricopeptide (TPR) repeat protein
LIALVRPPLLLYFGAYQGILSYFGLWDLVALFKAVSAGSIVVAGLTYFVGSQEHPRSVFVIDWALLLFILSSSRYLLRAWARRHPRRHAREKAIRLAPGYAPAWVALSDVWAQRAGAGYIAVEEGYRKAREAAERALSLDGDLGDAHAALGQIRMLHDWDWAGADESLRRALALKPGDAGVMRVAGSLARYLGHLDQALALYRRVRPTRSISPCKRKGSRCITRTGWEAKADFIGRLS